jgi:DNA-binding beta-propeller fold protein YncE
MKKFIFICLLIVTNFCFAAAADSHFLTVTTEGLNLLITPKKDAIEYPIAGIKILTPGFTASGCTRRPDGYCVFKIKKKPAKTTITLSKVGTVKYIVCLNAIDHLQCQYYTSTLANVFSKIYVANQGSGNPSGNIQYCSLIDGVISPTSCDTSDAFINSINPPANPQFISINKNAGKIYIAAIQGSILTCPLGINGTIDTPCSVYDTAGQLEGVLYNEKSNRLYYTQPFNGIVVECVLKSNGDISLCPRSVVIADATALAINNTTNQLYVSTLQNGATGTGGTVRLCPLVNGNLVTCNQILELRPPLTPTTLDANGLAVNEKNNKLYITNTSNDFVFTCSLTSEGNINGTCIANSSFVSPSGIAVNPAVNKLYIALQIPYDPTIPFPSPETVSTCNLNEGTIGSCTTSSSGGLSPKGVALN